MRKLGLIIVVLVLALGSLGVAYARWSDTVYIDGEIQTGEVCWEYTSCSLLDEIPSPPYWVGEEYWYFHDYTCNNGFVPNAAGAQFWHSDKNVGWGSQKIEDLDQDGRKETLTTTLENVYPCYFNAQSFYLKNCGTIPVKVWKIFIEGQEFTGGVPYLKLDLTKDGKPDIEISWGNNWGAQIDPGTIYPWEFSFWIHVLQDAPEGSTLTFHITVWATQWNEYP